MVRIAVCEYNQTDIALFQKEIDIIKPNLPSRLGIDYYKNGTSLKKAVENHTRYDLLILDIYLDDMNGIDVAHAIRGLLPGVQLAFLTSAKDYALDAFDLDAVHYLIKPVKQEDIHKLFRRFFHRSQKPEQYFEIRADKKVYSFPLSHVQKIQSHKKGVDIYLHNFPNPYWIPLSFIRVEEQLDPAYFLKISRGLIVHMSYILYIDQNICAFRDGTSALISRGEKLSVRKRYNDYLFSHLRKEEPL